MTQSKERVMGEEGLYRSSFEHDNCGIGAVVNIKGEKSHATVENALKIVENLEHRAGKDAEGKTWRRSRNLVADIAQILFQSLFDPRFFIRRRTGIRRRRILLPTK